MPILAQIRGQEQVVQRLRSALERDRVAHAYLFTGEPGSGKRAAALALATALNCLRTPAEGCGECSSCTRIDEGKHPDVVELERTGAAQIIPIDTIRKQVIPSLALAPHEGSARVFIVPEATALLGPAANALLKTLEEPPPRTHFVLLSSAPDQLLPTIRSRCQRVQFAPLSPEDRAAHESGGDDEMAAAVTALATRVLDPSESQFALAEELGKSREQLARVLSAVCGLAHRKAETAARAGDGEASRRWVRRADMTFDAVRGLSENNAHAQLLSESLLTRFHRGGTLG